MAARRQQRLVNLVLCLLSTRQFISAERIRSTVEGYDVAETAGNPDEAFKRSFERDKAELRELGVPLETGRNSIFDTEDGYRIARSDFELPAIEFAADEAAALGLAARLWSSATLAPEARSGLLKLRAAGVQITEPTAPDLLPSLPANEPALPVLLTAASTHQVVEFDYHKPSASTAERRTVEPWGVLSWRGRWYLVGHDRARDDARSFRLDRIAGEVTVLASVAQTVRPVHLDMVELVRGANTLPTGTAVVRVRAGRAGQLHRMARSVTAHDDASPPDGQLEDLTIEFRDVDTLAAMVAAAGTDALAVSPPQLVTAVIELLTGASRASCATVDTTVDASAGT